MAPVRAVVAVWSVFLICPRATAPAPPYRLRCEHAPPPLIGLDVSTPRLSWVVPPSAGAYGEVVGAHQVKVTDVHASRVVWDSGATASAALSTVYLGPPLAADTSFSWRVRVGTDPLALQTAPRDSGWSEPFYFRTAPSRSAWSNASWIDGSRGALRKQIVLPSGGKIVEAFIFASSIGFHHLLVNGALLGNQSTYLFEPGQSVYSWVLLNATAHFARRPRQLPSLTTHGALTQ